MIKQSLKVIVSFVPVLNSIAVIITSIINKRFKHTVIAAIFLVGLFLFDSLNNSHLDAYRKEKYNITDVSSLEVFYSSDISFKYPEYSLIKTELNDGNYENKVLKDGKTEIHKIEVDDGNYVSYMIYDSKNNLLSNYLEELYVKQVENFKKDNPDKIILTNQKEEMNSPYDIPFFLMMIFAALHTLYFLFSMKKYTKENKSGSFNYDALKGSKTNKKLESTNDQKLIAENKKLFLNRKE